MAIIDFPGLQYWYAPSYMLYQFQESGSTPGPTQVGLGTKVGTVEEQAASIISYALTDSIRPDNTSDGASNGYHEMGVGALRLALLNSQPLFPFFYEGARLWTIALKVRMDITAASNQVVFANYNLGGGEVGFALFRRAGGFFRFWMNDGTQSLFSYQTVGLTIEDNNWHDIVISSSGPGTDQVYIELDGVQETLTYLAEGAAGLSSSFELTMSVFPNGLSQINQSMSNLIIQNEPISVADKAEFRAFDVNPTLDPITPGGGGFGALIRSQKASLTAGLLSARGVGG